MGKRIDFPGRIHSTELGNVLAGANEIYDDTKEKKQNVINSETDAELVRLENAKQDNLTFDSTPTENSTNPVTSGGVYAADKVLEQAVEAILTLIPSSASALNQLADKSFVNSSIATASATFRGTYNLVSDLHLSVTASHQDIADALASAVSTADNNDYCFVQVPTSDTSSDIRVTERYKFNGSTWSYEYDLNNSGFTDKQWNAINSGITAVLVTKLGALPTAAELATQMLGKQNVLTFDNVPVSGSDNPVKSSGLYTLFAAIDAMTPTGAGANNKLVAEDRLTSYVTGIINALDATFDLTSADGHVTFKITQADGLITSVQILTSDIASASQVSTNTADITALQAAYAGLTQSDIVVVSGALPSSGQQQNVIYRQPDPDHTPPQFYSDYMWNGSTWVLMATYNNAIDPRPKKGSQNLVTSGGVFDNMGALDVSELNATENPHTLATYVDLSAALAAIPSDYQKGGMSIKFVQSSDNKYAQYRLMSDGWTIDTNNWAFCGDDVYVENPIYIDAEVDAEDNLLEGREIDGTKDFFTRVKAKKGIETNSIDTNSVNTDSVNTNSIDTNSINFDALEEETMESPEFSEVLLDNDEKIISARSNDGVLKEYVGIQTPTVNVTEKLILSETAKEKLKGSIKDGDDVTILVDKEGYGDYTSLSAAVNHALEISPYSRPYEKKFPKITIKVNAGIYDLEEEYEELFSQSYFANYSGAYNSYAHGYMDTGLFLGPNVELIGVGFVQIKFQYSGSNEDVKTYFSPLNTSFNNKVENVHFDVGNVRGCRYIIHDDWAYYVGTNIFKSITFDGLCHNDTTMGCGMGIHNSYILEDLYFSPGNANDIAYHNRESAEDDGARSYLSINNCKGSGSCIVQTIGLSTAITRCIVSNCEFGSIDKVQHSHGGEDNMELIKFNNVETNV